jgi:hypothetical protein
MGKTLIGTPTATWPELGRGKRAGFTGIIETPGRSKPFSIWDTGSIFGYSETEQEAKRWLREANLGRQGDPALEAEYGNR